MMLGRSAGETRLGYTYYPSEDRMSVLGFLDDGAVERQIVFAVYDDLETLSLGRAALSLSEGQRWARFLANDWRADASGEEFLADSDLRKLKGELDAFRSEYLAAIDALPQSPPPGN